ncbi:MAG: 2-hydroxyacid dehydrogenase [Acidobacteriaceae bacterium]
MLRNFPREAEIVRLPRKPEKTYEVDFWIPPFNRKAAEIVFAQLRGVKVVQSLMAGVDWLLPWLPEGVTLCDGRGIHDIPTSEWVIAAILASLKHFPRFRDQQLQHSWDGQQAISGTFRAHGGKHPAQLLILGEELNGKTVMIVGYGAIGAAVEARLQGFGVQIVRVARSVREGVHAIAEVSTLLPTADVIVLIVPLTTETRGMVTAEVIAKMKPGALLVNAARGPVVVTDALVAALEEGRIRAAVDVTDPEPLPPEHPLWSAPNCLITPHVAASTTGFLERAYALASAQVHRYVKGEPLENVVSSAGY